MGLSILLAKVWGLYLLIISLAFIANRKNYQILLQVIEYKGFFLFSGVFNLLVGIFMVLGHNIWSSDWRVIITLFGWIALTKGVVRLFWPDFVRKIIKNLARKKGLGAFLALSLALGLYLTYVGFSVQ